MTISRTRAACRLEQARRTMELDPSATGPHFSLALVLGQQGKPAEALAELDRAVQLGGGPYTGLRGMMYVANGQRDKALEIRKQPGDGPYDHFSRASIDIALGDLDGAFAGFNQALEKDAFPVFTIKKDPVFDPLRPS